MKIQTVRAQMTEAGIADRPFAFGRYKNIPLSQVPGDYVAWVSTLRTNSKTLPADLISDCRTIKLMLDAKNDAAKHAEGVLAGRTPPDTQAPIYAIERLGDLDGVTLHDTLEAALAALALEYPINAETGARTTPDPEDDRILIWEILPTSHKKVVWHFSGWHFDVDEYGLEQGSLPADSRPLYQIACEE